MLSYIETSILGVSGIYPFKQMAQKQIKPPVSASSAKNMSFGGLCTHRTKLWFVIHTHTPSSPLCTSLYVKTFILPQCLSHRHKGYWGLSLWTRCCRADMKITSHCFRQGAKTCIPSSVEAVNMFLCPAQAWQPPRPHFSKFRVRKHWFQ